MTLNQYFNTASQSLPGVLEAQGKDAHQINSDLTLYTSWMISSEQRVPEHLKNNVRTMV